VKWGYLFLKSIFQELFVTRNFVFTAIVDPAAMLLLMFFVSLWAKET
jgi:hypothetical protein